MMAEDRGTAQETDPWAFCPLTDDLQTARDAVAGGRDIWVGSVFLDASLKHDYAVLEDEALIRDLDRFADFWLQERQSPVRDALNPEPEMNGDPLP